MEKQLEIYLKLKKGIRTALADGSLVPESPFLPFSGLYQRLCKPLN